MTVCSEAPSQPVDRGERRRRRAWRGWRPLALAALLLLAAAESVASFGAADESLHHAGLVIRHGDGRLTYAYVAFAEEEIGGIDLLRRSGVEQVTIPFGWLGEGVCQIDGEGCPASECRRRLCQSPGDESSYWRYFGLDDTGAWIPFALGASSTAVHDGAVHGWSWTADEPGLPAVTLADVALMAGVPPAEDEASEPERMAYTQTIYPPGVEPPKADEPVEPIAYAAAIGVLLVIGGGAILVVWRGRIRQARQTERTT